MSCCVAEPCCACDNKCDLSALQICYFEDDETIDGINAQLDRHGEHTTWSEAQYEHMSLHRANNLKQRDSIRAVMARTMNAAACRHHRHEYEDKVRASLKELGLADFINEMGLMLKIMRVSPGASWGGGGGRCHRHGWRA